MLTLSYVSQTCNEYLTSLTCIFIVSNMPPRRRNPPARRVVINTITDVYNSEQGIVDVMFTFGIRQVGIDRIVDDGFNSMNTLVQQYESGVEGFNSYLKSINKTFGVNPNPDLRVHFAPPLMTRMMGALFYCNICYHRLHQIPDIRLITAEIASDSYKVYEDLHNSEMKESDQEIEVQVPELKGATNWRSFRDAFEMKLEILKSKAGFPLNYVVDQTPRVFTRANANRGEVPAVDLTEPNVFKEQAVHFGKTYKDDNKTVWLLLKSLLLNSSSYDHVLEFNASSNDRKAFLTLKTFYEGEDFHQRLQDQAFSIFKNTVYKGSTPKYKFDNYVRRHITAHKLLIEAEYNKDQITGVVKGMDDSTKIQHLKGGIKPEAGLEYALSLARTSGINKKTFTDYVSYLQAEVTAMENRKVELRAGMSVKQTDVTRNMSQNKRSLTETVEGKRLEAKRYALDEWKVLSPAQRSAVRRLNRKAKRSGIPQANSRSNNNKRSLSKNEISSISTAVISAMEQKHNSPTEVPDDVSKITENSDNQKKRKALSGGIGDFLSTNNRR